LILPIVSGLDESGIFSRWEYYDQLIDIYGHLQYSRKELASFFKTKSQLASNDNIMAYLLFKPHTAKSRPEAEPITVDFFVVFALLFGYCVAI